MEVEWKTTTCLEKGLRENYHFHEDFTGCMLRERSIFGDWVGV